MTPPIIYFDTSFFIGLLDNVANRRQDCLDVLKYEEKQGSHLYTSFLTINEFLVKTYDNYGDKPECEQKVQEQIRGISDIARLVAINEEILKRSALLMSLRGRGRKETGLPRDKKFRWDSLHLATANFIKADRVYTFDGPWETIPKDWIPDVQQIICPAVPPQPTLPGYPEPGPTSGPGRRLRTVRSLRSDK